MMTNNKMAMLRQVQKLLAIADASTPKASATVKRNLNKSALKISFNSQLTSKYNYQTEGKQIKITSQKTGIDWRGGCKIILQRIVYQSIQIETNAATNRRRTYNILQYQVPANDKGSKFSYADITVDIGRSCLGHSSAKFSITDAYK